MSATGWVHFIFCIVAIASGAVVLLLGKGTRWHRSWGHLYGVSMLGVVVSALLLYAMTGRFGPFHVAAIVALVTVTGGLYSVLARRPRGGWMEAHATWMAWSYIGLIAALASESATHFILPIIGSTLSERGLIGSFWGLVMVATFGVVGVGALLVRKRLPVTLARTPGVMHAERERLAAVEPSKDVA